VLCAESNRRYLREIEQRGAVCIAEVFLGRVIRMTPMPVSYQRALPTSGQDAIWPCWAPPAQYSKMVRPKSYKVPAWELLALCEAIERVSVVSNGTRRKSADGRSRSPGGSRIFGLGMRITAATPHCCHLKHQQQQWQCRYGQPGSWVAGNSQYV
jgi:hypothetical protein